MDESSLFLAATTTRWLVSDGVISLDGILFRPLAVQGSIWLLGIVLSAMTIALAGSGRARTSAPILLVSLGAILIGVCGYLTPFAWWRPIGYCQTDGDGQIALSLNTLFGVPWFIGVVGLAAVLFDRALMVCPNCGRRSIPFRVIWVKSSFGHYRCPDCAKECRVHRTPIYIILEVAVSLVTVGLGYWWAGGTGMMVACSVAILLNAWISYRVIETFHLLQVAEEQPSGDPR